MWVRLGSEVFSAALERQQQRKEGSEREGERGRGPETSNQQPATSNQQPATSNQKPETRKSKGKRRKGTNAFIPKFALAVEII